MNDFLDQQDVVLYKDAVCLPPRRLRPRGWMRGGVFDRYQKVIRSSLVYRYNFPVGAKPYDSPDLEADPSVRTERIIGEDSVGDTKHRLEGRYIFGGHFMGHYGHFLLETLSRLWFIKEYPDVPIVWIRIDQNPIQDWHHTFFEKLGVTNEFYWVDEQTEIEELIVPDAGYVIASRFWEKQARALELVGPTKMVPGKRIWLSRSELSKGVVLNEQLLESILVENGWTIYHPQHHSFDEQLDMLADAEMIAGIEGSAFHSLVLMPHFEGKVVLFGRVENGNYDLIADTHGFEQKKIRTETFDLPRIAKTWDNEVNRWWRDLDGMLDQVGARRKIGSAAKRNDRLFKITESLLRHFKAESMLECWATDDSLLQVMRPKLSLSVSAGFSLDVQSLKAKGARCFDIAPDVFLATGCLKPLIDVFCFRTNNLSQEEIEQTFSLSLEQSQAGSIWLFECGGVSDPNHKFVEALFAANPSMCAAWVGDSGVAVLWRARRPLGLRSLGYLRRTDLDQSATPQIPQWNLKSIAQQIEADRSGSRANSI